MLSGETLEKLSERLVDRIESLNQYFIKKLGKQINMIGQVTPSQLKELLQSIKYGNDIDEIMNEIAKVTNKNVEDIYEIFEEVAKKNQLYAKQFYDYKKVKYIPFEENDALQRQVSIIAKATATEYINMSKTMAYVTINNNGGREFNSLSDTYQRVTDEAILSIQQGRESFDTAVKRTMKQLTSNGLRTVDYDTGYSRRLDSSVRMSVMDGIRRLNRELQEQFGNEFGADGVEVSHHKNAAPDHIDTVDGQQFSKDEYKKINDSLERHVGELNCYHFVYPIVLGVSEPMYSKEELEADKKANKDGFEFEGTQYTNYEGTQLQRQLETKIRQYKDRQIGAKSINDKDEVYRCQEKIAQLTQKYNDLSKASGLPTKIGRLRVEGYRKVSGDTRKYYESQLIGTRINDISINGISNHLLDRKTSRNIKVEDVKEAFTTPLKIDKIKIDEQGRKSIKYIGEKATVSINPDTGTIITVWKTSSNRVKKLKGDK